MQTFTEMGHQARHEASERRRAAFVEWVDRHGGKDMLQGLKQHRHTLEEVAALAGAPINVVLTVGMEHYGVRLSRARDLGEPRSQAQQKRRRRERLAAPPKAVEPKVAHHCSLRSAEAKAVHHRTLRSAPPFFVQALLGVADRCPDLAPEQVVRGTMRVLRSEAARYKDHGYER